MLAGTSALALILAAPHGANARPFGTSSAVFAAPNLASDAAQAASQQAAAIAKQSQNALSRATQAIQAMQATQAAAHAAATAASTAVTDGKSSGGLIVDPRVGFDSNGNSTNTSVWSNISAPVESVSNGQYTETLTQTSQRAIATWQQFNVGKNTTVYFDQSAGNSVNGNSWVVLNRIDATGSPSQILGQIKADGTVLIINPNGIIFTGSSQINVHTLIASAMDINSYSGGNTPNVGVFDSNGSYVPLTANGVAVTMNGSAVLAPVNETSGNKSFLTNGLYTNGSGTLMFSAGVTPGQADQGVVVQPGATISTVTGVSGFDNGGYVALVGPHVNNAGSITTSAGEIVLTAGSNAFLTEPASGSTQTSFTATNVNPGNVLFVYGPAAVAGGALAVNTGLLLSTRGNITMVGDGVEQFGVAEATTSITRTGTITLTATGGPDGTGSGPGVVAFGPGSLTTILPEENGESIPTSSVSSFTAPSISVVTSDMDMQPGSLILAPGAAMTVSSVPQPNVGNTPPPAGRVLLEAGSEINLAGLTGVTLPVGAMLYTFKVTANDVADTPLAQNLIGQTVTIDLSLTGTRADGETWVGSPLFASSGSGYLSEAD
jgi:filamentous hemagglutinin family protein